MLSLQIFKTNSTFFLDFKSNIGKNCYAIDRVQCQLVRNDLGLSKCNFITKTRNTFYKKYQLNLSITWDLVAQNRRLGVTYILETTAVTAEI